MKKEQITQINGSEIVAVDNDGQMYVPIKPICQALEINYTTQIDRLQSDPTFSESTVPLRGIVAADGKEREMLCLPLMLVFLWLGSINPANVRDKARPSVVAYKLECARVLFEHFYGAMTRTIEMNNKEITLLREINDAVTLEKESKAHRHQLEQSLKKLRSERLNPQPQLFN